MTSKAAIKNGRQWYIIRAVPGTQRQARTYDGAARHRTGESILERECRNAGINVYMPSFWTTVQHQRTNRLIDKRFPLLIGYAFVNILPEERDKVRDLDSVLCILRQSRSGNVVVMQDEDIGQLMLADHLRAEAHKIEREGSEEKARQHRRNQLEKRLGQIFPKGRRKKMPVRMLAEAEIDKLPSALRKHVQGILEGLDAIKKEVDSCEDLPFGLNLVA